MADQERQGMRDVYATQTPYNQLEFMMEQKIREQVNTSALVKIDSCTSQGHDGPAGAVSATPMVAQTDADGNALPMVSIPSMPHARYQGGIAAFIVDPVAGDLAVASFCKADSSTVKTGTKEPQRPGSFRSFDQADGMVVATVSNKVPEIYMELKQDKKGIVHCPQGIVIRTPEGGDGIKLEDGKGGWIELKDGKCTIFAPNGILLDSPQTTITGNLTATGEKGNSIGMTGNVSHNGNYTQQGNFSQQGNYTQDGSHTSTGDQIAGGISQVNHTHIGVQPGGGNTGKPQ